MVVGATRAAVTISHIADRLGFPGTRFHGKKKLKKDILQFIQEGAVGSRGCRKIPCWGQGSEVRDRLIRPSNMTYNNSSGHFPSLCRPHYIFPPIVYFLSHGLLAFLKLFFRTETLKQDHSQWTSTFSNCLFRYIMGVTAAWWEVTRLHTFYLPHYEKGTQKPTQDRFFFFFFLHHASWASPLKYLDLCVGDSTKQ